MSGTKLSKNKSGNPVEVSSARSRLDGVLQGLVDKKEDGPLTEEDSPTLGLGEQMREPVSAVSPRKQQQSGKGSRKKRKGKEDIATQEMGHYHHTYVMKLFDRSVDLAQFDDDTPLYPICRAWMRNQPHNRNLAPRERSPSPDGITSMEDEESDSDVYRLPPPVNLVKSEPGEPEVDLRIPSPVHPPEPDHIDDYRNQIVPPSMDQLLLGHVMKWKKIRKKWKNAAHYNEARYADSIKILNDMFDKQCSKDQ